MALITDILELGELTTAQRDALTPNVATLIYNTTVGKAQLWNGTTWENLPKNDITTTPSVVQVKRTTDLTLTTSDVEISFDETSIESDSSVIDHDSTNTERIILKESIYTHGELNFQFTNTANQDKIVTMSLYRNSTTLLSSIDITVDKSLHQTVHRSLVVPPLVPNDYLSIKISVNSAMGGSVMLSADSRVIIYKMK